MTSERVVVAGQLARDLVLLVDDMPEAGTSADARLRREMLGGKGANQAVALAQLGAAPALVAVRGDDLIGDELVAQARRDGIDVSAVVCRAGTLTGLIVEALDSDGNWRYLQHLPEPMLLTADDVAAAEPVFHGAQAVLVQLQQPGAAALAAARLGRAQGALVVLDGAPGDDADRDALLAAADVVRTDDTETELLTGLPAKDPAALRDAVRRLTGPRLYALGLPDANYFVWPDGELLIPLGDARVVDTTGGGDAFTAALTVALLRGCPPQAAARYAVAASAATVGHPGGRPDLTDLGPVPADC
ncbi:PfkB family carbohydrate kinase [Actinoplanes sp. NPDC024001]|uniref:PfkB family carbohydrate kinase n=1 Tax=Actinoplanes sp. NPDC024001 TaxID=3154598 RepID=UPI003404E440